MPRFSSAMLLVSLFTCLACDDDEPLPPVMAPDAGPGTLILVENPANLLSFTAEWQTEEAIPTRIEVTCEEGYLESYEDAEPKTDHSVFVMGLIAETQCEVTVAASSDGATTFVQSFDVGPIPSGFPRPELTEMVEGELQPGWTLLDLNDGADLTDPMKVALFDEQGRYRWYYEIPVPRAGQDNRVAIIDEGVLVGARGTDVPRIVDWQGSILWEGSFGMHHDIRIDPLDDQRLLYLTPYAGCPGDIFEEARMGVWDRRTESQVDDWALCDHYTPTTNVAGWAHLNAIELFPGDPNAILLSSRDQSMLVKFRRDTGEIVWKLGPDRDFAMSDADRFYHQHAPEIQPDGHILLYDNGLRDDREWSRLVEIAYDEATMTAEVVWDFRPSPDIFTNVWGDADRLENGNTLGTFGLRSGAQIIEVTNDESVVWRLVMPDGWGVYRSDREPIPPLIRSLD